MATRNGLRRPSEDNVLTPRRYHKHRTQTNLSKMGSTDHVALVPTHPRTYTYPLCPLRTMPHLKAPSRYAMESSMQARHMIYSPRTHHTTPSVFSIFLSYPNGQKVHMVSQIENDAKPPKNLRKRDLNLFTYLPNSLANILIKKTLHRDKQSNS